MNEALQFLNDNREIALATLEDNCPKIRVFQIMDIDSENLYFATAPHKEVCTQLQNNPSVEILSYSKAISVRVAGSVAFDVSDKHAKDIFAKNPVLPRLYASYNDLAYFRLPISKLDYFDLTPTPPTFKHFENK